MPSKRDMARLAAIPVSFVDQLVGEGVLPRPRNGVGHAWDAAAIALLQHEYQRRSDPDIGDPLAGEALTDSIEAFRQARIADTRAATRLKMLKEAGLRGQYAPIDAIREVLGRVGREVHGVLLGVPGAIARRCPDVSPGTMELIKKELAKANSACADVRLRDDEVDRILTAAESEV